MGSLRASQHFDIHGAPITDPDYSNPTRRRMERPLETIRSFEDAIDREYRKQREAAREAARQSFAQNDNNGDSNGYESRRSSYWGGGEYAGNGYYNSPARSRGQFDGPPPSRNKFGARMNSEPIVSNRYSQAPHPYSTPGYGQTRDTIYTGGSNGSSNDQWHNSTDPSSDNSSIDRMKQEGHGEYTHPSVRQPIAEDGHYTYHNAGYNPAYMAGGAGAGPGASAGYTHAQVNQGPPAPPPKAAMGGMGGPVQPPAGPRQPIKLNPTVNTARPEPEKRKSWLKRTFSKN